MQLKSGKMKRSGNLFDKIISTENLVDAAYKASKNKRHRQYVIQFNRHLMDNIAAIRRELESGNYKPGSYREFYIYDKKLRKISAAPFSDRIVHHALCNVIMPFFEKSFIDNSFANRSGKGTHRAVLLCQRYLRQNKYYIKFDIQKYFPSIDHEVLKSIVHKKIKCRKTFGLVDLIIDNSNLQDSPAFYFPDDDLFAPSERRKGLPIGNLTSQYFANIYLTPLDHFITEHLKIKNYIRYVDDFVIFGNDKEFLSLCIEKITVFLEQYRLKIHQAKANVRKTCDAITFLGYRIFPYYIRITGENLIKARRRFKRNLVSLHNGLMSPESFNNSFQAWRGHIKIVTGFSNSSRSHFYEQQRSTGFFRKY